MLVASRYPLKFDHLHLRSEDPAQRVEALDSALAQAKEWEKKLTTLYTAIESDLREAADANRAHPSPSAEDRVLHLGGSLRQIDDGLGNLDGYHDPRLARIIGQPGLARTKNVIAELRKEREEWAPRIGQAEAPPAKFRVKKGTHFVAGGPNGVTRVYAAGEVVELTANQAKAWADRFEKIDGDDAPAKERAPITVDPDAPPVTVKHSTEAMLEKKSKRSS
jgi:hypothetical protein